MKKDNKCLKEKLNKKLDSAIKYFEDKIKKEGNKEASNEEMLILIDILKDFYSCQEISNQEDNE